MANFLYLCSYSNNYCQLDTGPQNLKTPKKFEPKTAVINEIQYSKVILGAIAIARSKIEDFDELKGKVIHLKYYKQHRQLGREKIGWFGQILTYGLFGNERE